MARRKANTTRSSEGKQQQPTRKSESLFELKKPSYQTHSGKGLRLGDRPPAIDIFNNFADSIKNSERRNVQSLRALADSLPVQVAIRHIIDSTISMDFFVKPPEEEKDAPAAIKQAKAIEKALKHPNRDEQNNYRKFVSSIVTDILIGNIAAIERQPSPGGEGGEGQPLWLWVVDYERIVVNEEWTADKEGLMPRYWDTGNYTNVEAWIPLLNKDLFLIQKYTNSWRYNAPSTVEIAFDMIISWLGLSQYQTQTTSKAQQEFLLDIGEVSSKELQAFREFFEVEVLGRGAAPIFGSKNGGINVIKLGASNDDGLYLKYQEMILRIIALAFHLSARDMNIVEPDNRATAGVAADLSFQRAILPMSQLIVEALQDEVVDLYYPGYEIDFIDKEPRSEKEEAETAAMLYEKKVFTLNEARVRAGEAPLKENGDGFSTDGAEKQEQPMPPSASGGANKASKEIEEDDIDEEPKTTDLTDEKKTGKSTSTKGKKSKAVQASQKKSNEFWQLSLF
ncbi:MAG: phage portal protein [Crinalium sp.]